MKKQNPTDITIRDSEIQGKLAKHGHQQCKYCFTVDSILISSSIVQNTNTIFLISNKFVDAITSLINGKIHHSLGLINIGKIKDWSKLKRESKWINIIFSDSENPTLVNILLLHLKQ